LLLIVKLNVGANQNLRDGGSFPSRVRETELEFSNSPWLFSVTLAQVCNSCLLLSCPGTKIYYV